MSCDIRNFWSIPFMTSEWNHFSEYSNELITIVNDLESSTSNVKGVEIAGNFSDLTSKWYTYNFLATQNQAVEELKKFIFRQVKDYIEKIPHKEDDLYYISWANLLRNKGCLSSHSHAGPYSYISGVFFIKSKGSFTRFYAPLDDRIPGVVDFMESQIDIESIEGTLVLFPSFIEHSTTPTSDGSPRITIAFDILKESPKDRFHNSYGYSVINKI